MHVERMKVMKKDNKLKNLERREDKEKEKLCDQLKVTSNKNSQLIVNIMVLEKYINNKNKLRNLCKC